MLQGIGLATEETKQRAVLWKQIESSLNRSLLGLFLEIAGCGIDFANISIIEGGEEERIVLRSIFAKCQSKLLGNSDSGHSAYIDILDIVETITIVNASNFSDRLTAATVLFNSL